MVRECDFICKDLKLKDQVCYCFGFYRFREYIVSRLREYWESKGYQVVRVDDGKLREELGVPSLFGVRAFEIRVGDGTGLEDIEWLMDRVLEGDERSAFALVYGSEVEGRFDEKRLKSFKKKILSIEPEGIEKGNCGLLVRSVANVLGYKVDEFTGWDEFVEVVYGRVKEEGMDVEDAFCFIERMLTLYCDEGGKKINVLGVLREESAVGDLSFDLLYKVIAEFSRSMDNESRLRELMREISEYFEESGMEMIRFLAVIQGVLRDLLLVNNEIGGMDFRVGEEKRMSQYKWGRLKEYANLAPAQLVRVRNFFAINEPLFRSADNLLLAFLTSGVVLR